MKINRVQTGVRLEKRLVSTLNQLADEEGQNLGEKLEEIVAHAFEGNGACAWAAADSLKRVAKAKKAHGVDYDTHACYRFDDVEAPARVKGRKPMPIQRVQVGFKMEKRMLKILKAIAELGDTQLGNLLEEITLHQMEGADAFCPVTIQKIGLLQKVYGVDYDTHATYRFQEKTTGVLPKGRRSISRS